MKKGKKKAFSVIPRLKKKTSNTKALMALNSFIATHKSEIIRDPALIKLADSLIADQRKQVRTVFSRINKACGELPCDEQVVDWFGINRTQARNVIKNAEAIYKSQKELLEGEYIRDAQRNVKSLKEQIKKTSQKLNKEIDKQKKSNEAKPTKRFKGLCKNLTYSKNKLNKAKQNLAKLNNQLVCGKFSVCFGTKELMRKFNASLRKSKDETLNPEERATAYKDFESQKNQWQFNRDSEYWVEGHSAQKSGNSRIQLTPNGDGFDLKINIPDQYKSQWGASQTFEGIRYGGDRRNHEISSAIKNIGEGTKRNRTQYPVTQRLKLVRDNYGVGVQVITTIYTPKATVISDRRNGAMGVDFNQHSLDWTIVDYYGNLAAGGNIALSTQDRTSEQTKDAVSKAVSQLFEIAAQYRVPLIFEDLSFKKNSENFKSKGKKFARMASNLPFATFKELVQQKSYRTGIAIRFVNPAFTSIIGLYKYMAKYGLSSGTAAGMVIARRGLGFKEAIPESLINSEMFPEDNKSEVRVTSWSDWGKLSRARRSSGKRDRHKYFNSAWLVGTNCSGKEEKSPSVGGREVSLLHTEKKALSPDA